MLTNAIALETIDLFTIHLAIALMTTLSNLLDINVLDSHSVAKPGRDFGKSWWMDFVKSLLQNCLKGSTVEEECINPGQVACVQMAHALDSDSVTQP